MPKLLNESLIDQLKDRKIDLDKIRIECLGLSTRAINALKIHNINTVFELINCPDNRILSMRNLGQTSLNKIKEKLSFFIEYLLNHDDSTLYSIGIFTNPENEISANNESLEIDDGLENSSVQNPITDLDYAFERLFEHLTPREKKVYSLRLGLFSGYPLSLDETGRLINNAGRESTRQIEKTARRKIVHSMSHIRKDIEERFEEMFLRAGGILNLRDIPKKLPEVATLSKIDANGVARFVFSTSHRFKQVDDEIWALNDYFASQFPTIISKAILILERNKTKMNLNYFIGEIFRNIQLDNNEIHESMKIPYIEACVKADNNLEILEINGHSWCSLAKWRLSHVDEIVEVLKSYGKPLTYRAITNFINFQSNGNEKVVKYNIYTVLRRRPDFFVLYESGTYGLVEWGIERSPTILYFIYEILKLEGTPLPLDEIHRRLNELRYCSRPSLAMYLNMNDSFVEFQRHMYGLREWDVMKNLHEIQPVKNGMGMTNFNHFISEGLAEYLIAHPDEFAEYTGFSFIGYVWYDGEQFSCQVWQRNHLVEKIREPTLGNIMETVSNKYGNE